MTQVSATGHDILSQCKAGHPQVEGVESYPSVVFLKVVILGSDFSRALYNRVLMLLSAVLSCKAPAGNGMIISVVPDPSLG